MERESFTRSRKIDVQLRAAGWMASSQRTIEEFVVASSNSTESTEFADYALIDSYNQPLAIVEAKRSCRNALEGERQAADYADRILQKCGVEPFIFLANGNKIWFQDRSRYPLRKVSGFFTQDDLERLRFLRTYHQPTADSDINKKIAGRGYQIEATGAVTSRGVGRPSVISDGRHGRDRIHRPRFDQILDREARRIQAQLCAAAEAMGCIENPLASSAAHVA